MQTPRQRAVALHDVQDLVAFVTAIAARKQLNLTLTERRELLSQLCEDAVRMSGIRHGRYAYTPGNAPRGVYDPGAASVSFSTWLGWQLPRRIIDWQRREHGDTRNKNPRPQMLSLDWNYRGEQDQRCQDLGRLAKEIADRRSTPDVLDIVIAREQLLESEYPEAA